MQKPKNTLQINKQYQHQTSISIKSANLLFAMKWIQFMTIKPAMLTSCSITSCINTFLFIIYEVDQWINIRGH